MVNRPCNWHTHNPIPTWLSGLNHFSRWLYIWHSTQHLMLKLGNPPQILPSVGFNSFKEGRLIAEAAAYWLARQLQRLENCGFRDWTLIPGSFTHDMLLLSSENNMKHTSLLNYLKVLPVPEESPFLPHPFLHAFWSSQLSLPAPLLPSRSSSLGGFLKSGAHNQTQSCDYNLNRVTVIISHPWASTVY